MTKLPDRSELGDGQMVCVQIDADGSQAASGQDRGLHHPGGGEHPPATSIALEPVAYSLSRDRRRVQPSHRAVCDTSVIRIGLKRRQDLLVSHRRSVRSRSRRTCRTPVPGKSGILSLSVSEPSSATVATHSWQPAVSSLLPSTKNSLLRASRQSASHSAWLS